ncbi:MAG: hypothetical protein HMLKMBBP_01379 [Planctomycetes bacterium]|nr:hypothetical protein [Planctomycetota bacterium]
MASSRAERAESIISAFAPRRRRQFAVRVAVFVVVNAGWAAFFLRATDRVGDDWLLTWGPWFGVVVCVVAAAHALNWRCPSCLASPGSYAEARFCQSCGVQIRPEPA